MVVVIPAFTAPVEAATIMAVIASAGAVIAGIGIRAIVVVVVRFIVIVSVILLFFAVVIFVTCFALLSVVAIIVGTAFAL